MVGAILIANAIQIKGFGKHLVSSLRPTEQSALCVLVIAERLISYILSGGWTHNFWEVAQEKDGS